MKQVMAENSGIGLAANQIGENLSVIIVGDMAMVNPVIVDRSRTQVLSTEACLSIPNTSVEVKRSKWVRVCYYSPDFTEARNIRLSGQMSVCAQHEIDHLNGILITDYRNFPDVHPQ